MKRLLIVADHSFVVEAIRLALKQTAGFEVVGFVDGRKPISDRLAQARLDVVLLDDMQQPETALERLREISAAAPEASTLLLTLQMDDEWLAKAFDAGAQAVISKTVHPASLGTLLRETARGNVVHRFQRQVGATVDADCPLTDRELEILRYAAQGYTNGRIAKELWVTEQTVKFHLSNTYRKLNVANRTEASRYAYEHRLVERGTAPDRHLAAA